MKFNFIAINKRELILGMVSLLLFLFIGISVGMFFLVYFNTRYIRLIVGVFMLCGISVFILFGLLMKLLSRQYDILIDDYQLKVVSQKEQLIIPLNKLEKIYIFNNTNYSKIIIDGNNKVEKYYIGLAKLLEFRKAKSDMMILTAEEITELEEFFKNKQFDSKIENQADQIRIEVRKNAKY